MKRLLTTISVWMFAMTVAMLPAHAAVTGQDDDFVDETTMKTDLLQMLATFSTYLKNDFQDCVAPNSIGEVCGCFKGENTMGNDERGVRPNADLSMICAFLVKYGRDKVTLPAGVTWTDLEQMAMKSLVFAYSTHKANKLKVCSGNGYWGSVSTSDNVWESSLWAMSVAYSAFFQWDRLSESQRNYVYQLLKAECNYELYRNIPTGYAGDTKAEENGWEADVLAATLGLFPDDPLAPKWFARLREFAINSYSQKDDAQDATVIDPDYDQATVKSLYKGQNLYDDYTLQNHNYFHTSYQNVVIQELGEAALALKLFQQGLYGEEKWKTNALMHNNDRVMKDVLYWLALSDGELAMPNGNDWSLFLYDQITSYSTNACFLRDPHALMLENMAYRMIKARQQTTTDGSWLLRADVGARRMGAEAHRVMMTWLMHEMLTTADMTPTRWADFNTEYERAKVFSSQNIVRASSKDRFTCFSWSTGLNSYTGYIAPHLSPLQPEQSNLIVPFRANNTGNFLGWYEVQGKKTNATPVVSGIYELKDNGYVMNGELNTNDAALNHRFAIYSTPGNAVIYIDNVRANVDATITKEKGGLMAISVDDLTKTKRTLFTEGSEKELDGSTLTTLSGRWVNVDNALGIVTTADRQFAFGEKANNNSVMTAKLYALYNASSRTVKANEVVGQRVLTYYSNVSAEETSRLSSLISQLSTPEGWNAAIAFDPDQTAYLLVSNFCSDRPCSVADVRTELGSPVFSVSTTISDKGSSATFIAEENHSVADVLCFFIEGTGVEATQDKDTPDAIYLLNQVKGNNQVTIHAAGRQQQVTLGTQVLRVSIVGGELLIEEAAGFPRTEEESLTDGYQDVTDMYLTNASFEEDETYGDPTGNLTVNGVNYNPCYVNTVGAANSKWPNVLPVKGWKAGNTMTGGSKFCHLHSMPYSTTMFCVSPSDVGNSATRCSRPLFDSSCGDRVLQVLNSWDKGSNAITQQVTLPAGTYRLLLDARYECNNQTANNGKVITTSGNNTCTSLTGIKIGTKTDYRYPSERNTWQQLCYDFELSDEQAVTLSMGYQASASAGAANNTMMYIDHVQLFRLVGGTQGIGSVEGQQPAGIYDLQGRRVNETGHSGLYICNGKKVLVR